MRDSAGQTAERRHAVGEEYLSLGVLAVGHVAHDDLEVSVEESLRRKLAGHDAPVLANETALAHDDAARGDGVEADRDGSEIVGVQHLDRAQGQQLVVGVTEHPAGALVGVDDRVVGRHEEDALDGLIEDGAVTLFGQPDGSLEPRDAAFAIGAGSRRGVGLHGEAPLGGRRSLRLLRPMYVHGPRPP